MGNMSSSNGLNGFKITGIFNLSEFRFETGTLRLSTPRVPGWLVSGNINKTEMKTSNTATARINCIALHEA
ncbi:hypothetical protein EST38_g7262 [Candolleomyces aberdarensis]|uniref:Uncharacterized protein n=1 Tax=Candolleomyces aberdarensis TaxID=2316362 RepID=A0A4Q2DFJ7_9AGAR|nr:hypothetical protein EST38_g7262 [Candolleomyces aberdarensis]